MGSYNVVFRYTKPARGYCGVITWKSFTDKQHFDNWLNANLNIKERQEVVEEGVTEERAIELVRQTPFKCYIASSVQESITPDGKFNLNRFMMKINGLLFTRTLENPEGAESDLESLENFLEAFVCVFDTISPLIVPA
ncbi:MAG: hypothetical protein Q7U36_03590 [bacterium]|nr:hypothetical protein [bacterium]